MESLHFSDLQPSLLGGSIVLIAMYPYESRADGDLSFKKGDQMILIDSRYARFFSFFWSLF